MSEKLIRTLTVEPRIVSAKDGTVDYVASDATLDSYREIIDPRGWRFTHFAKNAPFVDSHDYGTIGKMLGKVIDFRVAGDALVERVQWAKDIAENVLAVLGWKLTEGGFLKAVSVGFFPTRSAFKDTDDFRRAGAELKVSAEDMQKCRRIFLEQEQIELSACIIGANPNALAKAWKAGCVVDADLAKLGLCDDDMDFVSKAESAIGDNKTGEGTRLLLQREIVRIFRRQTISGQPTGPHGTGTSASTRAAAEEAERRAADGRREILKALEGLCS